jgi:hypothetical protein
VEEKGVDELEGEDLDIEIGTPRCFLFLTSQYPIAEGDQAIEAVGEDQVISVGTHRCETVDDSKTYLSFFLHSSRPLSS